MHSGPAICVEADFAAREDLFCSGVVIVAFAILLASCYQPSCVHLDLIYAQLPGGHSILDTTITIDKVLSDIWKVVH
jgi:hypothetical protein